MRGAARMTTSLQAREQALSVIEMRREGMSTVTIAAATGLSESTVRRRISAALRALGSETADEARRTAESRYEDILQRAYRLLEELEPKDHPRVLSLITSCTSDLVKLNGLAVPAALTLKAEGFEL